MSDPNRVGVIQLFFLASIRGRNSSCLDLFEIELQFKLSGNTKVSIR